MVFLFIFLIILLLIILFLNLTISINIEKIQFTSQKIKNRHLRPDYKVTISFLLGKKLKVLSSSITKEKLEKLNLKEKIPKIETDLIQEKNLIDKEIIKNFKRLDLKIKKIDIKIELGTENAAYTALIVSAIGTILAIFLQRMVEQYENQKFEIQPLFLNENRINVFLEGIIEIKMIHIIDTICRLIKKRRVDKHERTSHRRSYDYSYE